MSKHTLEQVLEALINKEEDRASELLHQFFVAKGKSIYEELSQLDQQLEEEEVEEDADLEEGLGGAAGQDFEDEIIADEADLEDEQLFGEADGDEEDPMSADEPTEPEATADLLGGDEAAPAEGGDEAEAMQKIDAATDALEELKAIFADIMGDNAGGAEEAPAADDEATEESLQAFGEGVALKAVPSPTHGDNGQNTKSPVATTKRIDGNGAKAVDFTGQADGKGGTQGGVLNPSPKTDDMGNVNKVGNAKAPAPKGVAVPKTSDTASNKTSPVAKS
jgi:hypothetical protein